MRNYRQIQGKKMKIKLQPGGKLIVALFCLIILYLLFSLTGLIGIFSSEGKKAAVSDTTQTAVKIPDRPLKIGFVAGNLPENIFLANGNYETTETSIFHKYGLKALLVEVKSFSELTEMLKTGGDKGGIDIAYINTAQFVQKYGTVKESNVKCFMLSDMVTETNYLLSDKNAKSIKDLNKKRIALNDINSSLLWFAYEAKKTNLENFETINNQNDKESFQKLVNSEAAAAVIKDKSIVDGLKSLKNVKQLYESPNKLTNILAASTYSINEYFAYLKTVAKCCMIASDSLKAKKGYHANISFSDMANNISYITEKSGNGFTPFEIEISGITKTLSAYCPGTEKINPAELLYTKIISELSQIKVNNVAQPAQKSDTIRINKPIHIKNVIKDSQHVKKTKKIIKSDSALKIKPKSEITKKIRPVKSKTQDKSVNDNYFMINFDPNSTNLDSIADSKLSKVADNIRSSNPKQVFLTGHTDSTGEEVYNLMLSRKRAETVMDYLSKNFGFDKNIFKTAGKGSKEPLGKNSDKKWKKLNRRVNITIKNK